MIFNTIFYITYNPNSNIKYFNHTVIKPWFSEPWSSTQYTELKKSVHFREKKKNYILIMPSINWFNSSLFDDLVIGCNEQKPEYVSFASELM